MEAACCLHEHFWERLQLKGELVTNSIDQIQEVPDEESGAQDSGTMPIQTMAKKPKEVTKWSGRLPNGEAVINLL